MKTKTYILTFFMLLSGVVFGQDSGQIEIKFKIDTKLYGYDFIDFEVLVNGVYFQVNQIGTDNRLSYNSDTKEYKIELSYIDNWCLFGWYPPIYLKVNAKYNDNIRSELLKGKSFFQIIPIRFECKEKSNKSQKYDLGIISLREFLEIRRIRENSQLPFDFIEVKTDNVIHKHRQDEYELDLKEITDKSELRRMFWGVYRAVKLELENEN